MTTTPFALEIDVLVVGSGAAGLTAALAASTAGGEVLIVEKSDEFGGTSATSGGGIWVPNSDGAKAVGMEDSDEEAFEYMRSLTEPDVPDASLWAYIREGRKMVRWVHANSPVRFTSQDYPDYHVELPGGKPGHRTHLPENYDGRALGDDIRYLRSTSPVSSLFGKINWKFDEIYKLLYRGPGWPITLAKMLWRYYSDIPHRFRSDKDRTLVCGMALVGGLFVALKERGVPLWRNSRLVRLELENGRIIGATINRDGAEQRISLRRGVILAAGGFERNAEMRAQFLKDAADPGLSGSQRNNSGDAITAAAEVGAGLRNMESCWASPVFRIPGEDRARPSFFERALPGAIMVDAKGRRYLNEAASYHVVGHQMMAHHKPGEHSWLVFDGRFRFKYPAGPLMPLIPDWLHRGNVRSVVRKARTIEELAKQIVVEPGTLCATIAAFNDDARVGVDRQFSRGSATYDRLFGDAAVTPNPNLAPLDKAPYYAMPIYGGDIGTNGGVDTDAFARGLDRAGKPIAGLYAIGNCAGSVMGMSYPGAGATIGPGMIFGYIAGHHIMDAPLS